MPKNEREHIKHIVAETLPEIVREEEQVRQSILELGHDHFADKASTEGRFEAMLAELQREREEQAKRWEELNRRWDKLEADRERRWQELRQQLRQQWEELNRRWDKLEADREQRSQELRQQWQELQADRERRWQKYTEERRIILDRIEALVRRYEQGIGALGARWGIQTEASFRNALKGILEDSFGVQVLNLTEYDEEGEVFGRPDQVEVDVLIKNGEMIMAEIKSSMSRSDMYTFDRKVRYFEKKLGRPVKRRLVISPMVEERAKRVAEELGIEVFSYAEDAGETL